MKKYIIIATALLGFTACNLETPPESNLIKEGFWENEQSAKAAFDGVYSRFRAYGATMWQMGELRSDMWGGKSVETHLDQNLFTNNISTTVVPFGNWGGWYGMLHFINDFIKNAPNAPFSNIRERDNMLAQMHGLRAYVYYTLHKSWGKVPIVLQPLENVNDLASLKTPRASEVEVMNQIKSDIQKSLDLFTGNENFYNNRVYWTKNATLILKGDAYLWSGKVLGGGASDYTEAKNALSQVTGSLVSYENLWGINNENNAEFIFALDYKKDEATHYFNSATARFNDVKDKFDDNSRKISDILFISGNNFYSPSSKTLLLIDDVNDLRRQTFTRVYADNTGGYIPFVPTQTQYMGAIFNKFIGRNDSGAILNENNIPIYRYAEVLLLLAEAKNQLGEDPSAEINQIRQRAYGSNYNVATHGFTSASQQANAKAILDERYKEFIGEGKRWWDLLRAGDNFVYDEVPSMIGTGAVRKPVYLPINPIMIADDSTLNQTEGYE